MVNLLKIGKYILVPILADWCELLDYLRLKLALMENDKAWLQELCHSFSSSFRHNDLGEVIFSPSILTWLETNDPIEFSVVVREGILDYLRIRPARLSLCDKLLRMCCWKQEIVETRKGKDLISKMVMYVRNITYEGCLLIESLLHCQSLLDLTITRGWRGYSYHKLILPPNVICRLQYLRFYKLLDINCFIPVLRVCPYLLEFHSELSDCSQLAKAAIVWCRNLICFDAFINSYKVQYLLAFHLGKQCKSILVDARRDLLLRTKAYYRGGQALKKLDIVGSKDWSLSGAEYVAACCPNLEELKILCIPVDEHYLSILSCFKLTRLSIHFARFIEATAFLRLFQDYPLYSYKSSHRAPFVLLRSPSTCQCLQLSYRLTEFDTCAIAQYCPHLTFLDVRGSGDVSDTVLLPIIQKGKLQHLEIASPSITSDTLYALCTYCSSDLKHLNVNYFCIEEALCKVVEECRSLRYLHFGSSKGLHYAVTNAAMRYNRRLSVHCD